MNTKEPDPPVDGTNAEPNDVRRRAMLARPLAIDPARPLSAAVSVETAAASRQGSVRGWNDDHYLVLRIGRSLDTLATSLATADVPAPFAEYGYGLMVADGLGHDGSGSVASRAAVSALLHMALEQGRWNVRVDPIIAAEIMDRVQQFYNDADLEVFAKSLEGPQFKGIATSLTTACSAGETLFLAHVGHSRAYLYRDGLLTQMTRDHTIETHLATHKRPVAIERRGQDLQHVLTGAIGAGGGTPPADIEQFRLVSGDTLLLCTNGLTDVMADASIAEVLARPRQVSDQCAMLIDLAAQAGAEDNVTVVLAHYQIPAP